MGKESRKVLSSLRDKESFLAVEESTIRGFEVVVGGLRMDESMVEFSM
jgi:hypothetical protein